MTPPVLRTRLLSAWHRLRGTGNGSISRSGGYDPNTRINDGAQTDWMATARPAPAFMLDARFDAPAHVPGWMLEHGTTNGPRIDPVPLPNHFGAVTTADAIGHEDALAAHYQRILQAAPPPTRWRPDIAQYRGFAVDLAIGFADEHPLQIDMLGGAVLSATELLQQLADPASPDDVLYDNLDQGWALRMTTIGEQVFTLKWDWERPASQDTPRALRFPRPLLAVQAQAALQRLEHVHGVLAQAVGTDLWMPPRRP